MNKRIEKLFDQALDEFKAENKYATIVVPDPLQRDFVEKFAQLIVQECAGLLEKEAESGYDEGTDVYNVLLRESNWIKKHFGVE